jgi:hypothetical protein
VSKANIRGAQQWHDEIGTALKRCDWFLLVLSPQSVRSMWVKHELVYALQASRYRGRIIPVLCKRAIKTLCWAIWARLKVRGLLLKLENGRAGKGRGLFLGPQEAIMGEPVRPSAKPLTMAFFAMVSLCLPESSSAQIEIPEGTKVRVRLDQQLSSETAKEGAQVQLSVFGDITVGDAVAIKRGTAVAGTVISAVPEKNLGRAGKLDFSIDAILAPDGGKIPLRYSLEKNKGGSSAKAGIIMYGLLGLPGLLVLEGHNAILYEGAAYDVFTDIAYTPEPNTDAPSAAKAEDSADAPSIGVVYLLDASSHTLKAIPDEAWTARAGGRDTGVIEVPGERSFVRIVDDKPTFVYKIGNPENAHLYALTIDYKDKKKTWRWFSLVHVVGKTRQVSPGVPVEITKFGQSSYKLVPTQPLRPGEYAVLVGGSKVFTFGIDLK